MYHYRVSLLKPNSGKVQNCFSMYFKTCFINSWHKSVLAVTWKLAYLYHSCHLLKEDRCLVIHTVRDKQLELKLNITCLELFVTTHSYCTLSPLLTEQLAF